MSKPFVNFSSHSSCTWKIRQIEAAKQYSDTIVDVQFPNVDPFATKEAIKDLAEYCFKVIKEKDPVAVMCQGEFTLTYAVIAKLKDARIPVLAACDERKVRQEPQDDGTYKKSTYFEFVQFREY